MSIHVLLLPTDEDGISAPSAVTPATSRSATSRSTEEAFPYHLRNVRQVHVQVVEQPSVDLGAAHRVGLVGHAQIDSVDSRQRAVELGRGRHAGPDADGETVTARGRVGDATDQRRRYRLRIASTGESAHSHVGARRYERGGLLS